MALATPQTRISPVVLRWAQVMGVGLDELCHVARLDPTSLASGVTHAEGMRLWRALETLTGDPCVGLTAGGRVTSEFMGAIGIMFATAHDLADGLTVLGNALPILLQSDALQVKLSPRGGEIVYTTVNDEPRHGIDALLAAILTVARLSTGHRIVPLAVELQYGWPAHVERYVSVFGVQPAFDQPRCVVRFAARDLTRPFHTSDAATKKLLLSHAAELVGPSPEAPLSRIEQAIERSMAQGGGSLASAAAQLRVSSRTLQRQLAQSGISFETLRTRVRYELALEQLRRGIAVSEVATALGYESRTAFSRAFQRWTGMSPTRYIEGLRRPASPE